MEIFKRKLGNGSIEVKETQTYYSCGGTGKSPQFKHIQNGTCFKGHGQREFEKKILFI